MRNPQVAEVVFTLGVKTQLPTGVFRYGIHLSEEVGEYFGKCRRCGMLRGIGFHGSKRLTFDHYYGIVGQIVQ